MLFEVKGPHQKSWVACDSEVMMEMYGMIDTQF